MHLGEPDGTESALKDFTEAIRLAPDEPHLYILRSHVLTLLGQDSSCARRFGNRRSAGRRRQYRLADDLSLILWAIADELHSARTGALPYNLLIAVTPSDSALGLENVKRLLIEFFRNSGTSVPTPKILVAFHCCA